MNLSDISVSLLCIISDFGTNLHFLLIIINNMNKNPWSGLFKLERPHLCEKKLSFRFLVFIGLVLFTKAYIFLQKICIFLCFYKSIHLWYSPEESFSVCEMQY